MGTSSLSRPAATDPREPIPASQATDQPNLRDRLFLAVPLVALGTVYGVTLCPGPCFGDPAELTVAATVVGLPHPTGYPLFVAIGAMWVRLAWFVPPALALNLASALVSLMALWLLGLCLQRLRLRPDVTAAVIVLAGVAPPVWNSAIVTEVYALHAMLGTSVLALLAIAETGGGRRALWAACAVAGLAMGNHMTSVFLAPAIAGWALLWNRGLPATARLEWSSWAVAVGAWIAGIATAVVGVVLLDGRTTYNYVTQYLVENPGAVPDDPVGRALWVLTAQQYSAVDGFLHGIVDGRWLPDLVKVALLLLGDSPALVALGTAGLISAVLLPRVDPTHRRLASAGLVLMTLQLGFFATYLRSFETSFFATGWMALGLGVALLPEVLGIRCHARRVYALAVLLLASLGLAGHARSIDWSEATSRYRVTVESLDLLEPSPVVFSTWADSSLLWYATLVEGHKPGLTVINALPSNWGHLAHRFEARPVYFTGIPHGMQPRDFQPVGRFLRWQPGIDPG